MTRADTRSWPIVSGASLMMFPLGADLAGWRDIERQMRETVTPLGVDVFKGAKFAEAYVRAGVMSVPGIDPDDVLVFSCPAGQVTHEAAPLLMAAESRERARETAEFFRLASSSALLLAPRVAWVAAHDWSPKSRVRWQSGRLEEFVSFATSPDAWRTNFMGQSPMHVEASDEWPFWFEVYRD